MNLIPNIPPKLFTLSAIAVGYILIDDLTANEQNALGNWLMLTAQVLCTNAFYKQVQMDRMQQASSDSEPTLEQTVNMLKKMVDAMNEELQNLEKKL